MQNISLTMPDDIICEAKSLPFSEGSFSDKLQVSLAIGMFVTRQISLAKAAQLAQKPLADFMEILKNLEIPVVSYSLEMLAVDEKFVSTEH